MNRRSLVSIGALVLGVAVLLSATIVAQVPASACQARAGGESPSADRQAVHTTQDSRWSTGPPGLLDQLHVRAARTAAGRDEGDLHASRSRGRDQSCGGQGGRADRAGHHSRRALRLQPVRARSQPVEVRGQPAHLADHRSAGREDSCRSTRRDRSARPSARQRGRLRAVSTTRCRTCRSDRAASSWAGQVPR